MAALFTPEDLANALQETINNDRADVALRRASGWLSAATGLTEWPDPIPDDLWAWGIELGILAYTNAPGVEEEQEGSVRTRWGQNTQRMRINEILTAARAAYRPDGRPSGEFPDPEPWPDPPAPHGGGPSPGAYLGTWWIESD